MEQFDVAFGRCTVGDGVLRVERADPAEMGRWELFRTELSQSASYRPWATRAWIGVILALGLIFVGILGFLYASNPAVAPLVGGLALGGLLVVGGSVELRYRRELRERRRLQATLAEEFSLARPTQIPLDEITGVTVRPASTGRFLSDGYFFLVHFQTDGEEATVPLGFPDFMNEEMSTARMLFEQREVPITDDT